MVQLQYSAFDHSVWTHGAATVLCVWSQCMNAWCSYSTRRLITVYERMVQLQHFLAIEQQVLFACSYSTRRLIIVCAVCMQLQYFSAFDHRVCTVCMMQRQYFSGGGGGRWPVVQGVGGGVKRTLILIRQGETRVNVRGIILLNKLRTGRWCTNKAEKERELIYLSFRWWRFHPQSVRALVSPTKFF